jgi:AraC-like DNA-binding protein
VSSYREHLVRSSVVCCTWEQRTTEAWDQRVVPDGCVDLVWSGERLTIAGPDTRARLVALAPASLVVGVRLRPGAAGAVLGLPAGELRDAAPDAGEVLERDQVERLLEVLRADGSPGAGDPRAGNDPHAILLAAIERRGAPAPDALVRAAVSALDRPHARVAAVAAELGVSARQLQRRATDAVGYGPKTLARVLRFRRLQTLPAGPLVERALEAGYADQAHMTAEVTALAGISPVRFLKDRAPTAA